MKKLLVNLIFLTASLSAIGQHSFRTLLEKNIQYYQKSSKLSYSVNLTMFKDSLSTDIIESEQMHVYSSGNKQCVLTEDRMMIKEDGLLVSVLNDEKTVVLQNSLTSFKTDYLEQLEMLLQIWEALGIEEMPIKGSDIVYRITLPDGMDYSMMDLQFNEKTEMLSKSVIWLAGEYEISEENYEAPRIEMIVSKLQKPEIAKYELGDIVTKELELTTTYESYLFYNTVQKK